MFEKTRPSLPEEVFTGGETGKEQDIITYLPQTLILVRHGESVSNELDKAMFRAHQDGEDYSLAEEMGPHFQVGDESILLTPRGISQSVKLGKRLSTELGIDVSELIRERLVYASDMDRAHQTAFHMGGKVMSLEEDSVIPELREQDLGLYPRMTIKEHQEHDPTSHQRRQADPVNWRGPHLENQNPPESWLEMRNGRAMQALSEVASRSQGHDAAIIVSHAQMIRALRSILEHAEGDEEIALYARGKEFGVQNAGAIVYSKADPDNGFIPDLGSYGWARTVLADDGHGTDWIELKHK